MQRKLSYNFIDSLISLVRRQGHSSTKIVGAGPRSGKNVGHHCWPTEKILDFEWSKKAQMAMKFLFFFQDIFKYI